MADEWIKEPRFRNRKRFYLALVVGVLGLSLLAYCWTHRVWTIRQWWVYHEMDAECHPAWRDFHYGRVRAGDSVDDVIPVTEPVRVQRFGRWVELSYQGGGVHFTGMTATAYDGRMVGACAWSCQWQRQFFDTMSEEHRTEFFTQLYAQPARLGNETIVK